MSRSKWAPIAVLAPVVLAVGVRFTTPGLGLGPLATPSQLGVLALVIGTGALAAMQYPATIQRMFGHRPSLWLLGFGAFAVLSTLWSVDPTRTLAQALATLALIVVVIVSSDLFGWHVTRAVLVRGFVAVLLVGSLADLLADSEEARWIGLAGAATQLAQFAVMTALLALLGWWRRHESGLFTAGVVGLSLIEIAMSQSRVALLTLICLTASIAWARVPRVARSAAAAGIAATVATLGLIAINQIGQLALRDDAEAGDLAEFSGRTAIWPEALELAGRRPLGGFGFASGETVWARQVVEGQLNWFPSNAHNIVLEALVSLGVPGLILLTGATVSVLIHAYGPRFSLSTSIVLVVSVLGATEAMVHFASPAIVLFALATAGTLPRERAAAAIPGTLVPRAIRGVR